MGHLDGVGAMAIALQGKSSVLQVAGLSLVLVLYNNLANVIPQHFHDRWYVPMNLCFLGLLLLWAFLGLHLSRADLGFSWPEAGRSSLWGLALGLLLVAPLFVLAAFPHFLADRLQDPRLVGITGAHVLYRAAVRIPLGTALFEEMAFRGILFGALLRFGQAEAILLSSLVFGLWHIVPTWELLRASALGDSKVLLGLGMIGGVVATFVGGVLFALLRRHTGSVTGPILAHGLINSLALVAMFLRQR